MPDFNKGDFTQQGVNGHVNATVRLNEKRLVNIDLTSDEDAEGCTITGTVKDLLNDKVYGIGSGVSGNIEITENGENINVAPYATATVNVSGGGGLSVYTCTLHCINNLSEAVDFADTFASSPTAYAIDPETNYLMPAIDISAIVEPNESLDIVLFIQAVEGGLLACVFDGEYSSTMLYNAVNCSRIYDSDHDQTAIACEQGKNAEITFEVGGDS